MIRVGYILYGEYTMRLRERKKRQTKQISGQIAEQKEDESVDDASTSTLTTDKQVQREEENMANSEMILKEIRDFRQENGTALKGIQEEIQKTNTRIDEAEKRIAEAEDRVQGVEAATLELLKLQAYLEARLTDQDGRSRRDNIRIHGVCEGAEENSTSMIAFVETLLKEKLELSTSTDLRIERAHRTLGQRPAGGAPPRSIVVKFASYRTKEEIVKAAWQKRGFVYQEKRVNIDHDYAPEVLKKRKEYTEAKRVLKEKNIRFQTPFPAKLRVFFQDETRLYSSAEEATKEMAERGLPVTVYKPTESAVERIRRLAWNRVPGGREAEGAIPRQGYKEKLDVYRR